MDFSDLESKQAAEHARQVAAARMLDGKTILTERPTLDTEVEVCERLFKLCHTQPKYRVLCPTLPISYVPDINGANVKAYFNLVRHQDNMSSAVDPGDSALGVFGIEMLEMQQQLSEPFPCFQHFPRQVIESVFISWDA